jgi:hypothetical protein
MLFFEGLFSPAHLLVFLVGGICLTFAVVGVVLLVVFVMRRGKDEGVTMQLKEDNDRLREEIEKLSRGK